jgi:hypothetical protein
MLEGSSQSSPLGDTVVVEGNSSTDVGDEMDGTVTANFALPNPADSESLFTTGVVDSSNSGDTLEPTTTVTSQSTQSIPPPPRATIRMQLHGFQPPSQTTTARTATINPTSILNRIPLQFHSNQVHLNLGNGNRVMVPLQRQTSQSVDGITTASGRHGNVNIRVVQVDPLIPQPIESIDTFSTTHTATNVEQQQSQLPPQDDPAWSRFKCDVCFDFIRVMPVGCGKSSTCVFG